MVIQVAVTQQDISEGRRGSCRSCPVARAVNRALLDAGLAQENDWVHVSTRTWNLQRVAPYPQGVVTVYDNLQLPPHACEFIHDFDATQPGQGGKVSVHPFAFAVEVPSVR